MSVVIQKNISYSFSSNPTILTNGNVSLDGSRFSVTLDNPISIPASAVACTISIIQANIFFTQFNISAALGNNTFGYRISAFLYTFTIPDGLYSLDALQELFGREFVNNGFPSNLIVFSADSATQKVIATYPYTLTQAEFTDAAVPNNVRTILGFDSRLSPLLSSEPAGYSESGDDVAAFNQINSFYIRSSMVSNGLPVNNSSQGVIGAIPIGSTPAGSRIDYEPNTPIEIDCGSDIIGKSISNITFELLDDSLRPAGTNGEYYQFIIQFVYSVLLTNTFVPIKQF